MNIISKLFLLMLLSLTLNLALPNLGMASKVEDLSEISIYYLQNKNFDALASLFLLPSSYSKEQLFEEKAGLKDSLELLTNEFGTFASYSINKGPAQWYELFVAGGDGEFLKNNPNFHKIIYKTEFSKLGSGFIIFQIYDNNGNPKIRAVGFALISTEENVTIAKAIGKKMWKMMQ